MRRVAPPGVMWMRLVAGGGVVAVGAVGLAAILGAAVQGPAASPRGGWMVWGAVAVASMSLVVMAAAAVVVRRTRLLHRTVARVQRGADGATPPPSEAALRDAFHAPRWMMGATGPPVLIALAVHGALQAPPGMNPSVTFLLAGTWTLGMLPAARLWERAMWAWLREVPPQDVLLATRRSVAASMGLAVGIPLLGTSLVAMGGLVSHGARLEGQSGAWATLLLGASALWMVGVGWARRQGDLVGNDLRRLATRIGALRQQPEGSAALEGWELRTQEGEALGRQVIALAEHHGRSLAEEADAQRAIEEVQRLKSRFMAYVSHDLRSPLNSIKGFAEVLARETDGPLEPAQHESVEMIRQAGDDLLRLVNDILDAAQLEADRLPLRPAWTPSVEILTEAAGQARALIDGREIEIVTELEPGLPPVYADRDRVVQAVVGILAHVVRVLRHGTIRLRAQVMRDDASETGHLRVEVIDESASLREEDRERLFEAFRAVREPSGRRIGGLGLGLSLARGLVAAHGGDVWCERRDPGGRAQVTAFCVSLPLTMGHGP